MYFYASEGTSGGILKSHSPSIRHKLCVSHNSKNDKGNLIKLCRKIKQNEKMCGAQNLGAQDQGQGHNPRSRVCHLQIVSRP